MTAQRQLRWRNLFLILSVLPCCWSLQVSISEKEYKVARGDDVTFTCSFTPARPISNALFLSWEAYPDESGGTMKLVASYFLNNPVDIAPAYEGRAFLEVDLEKQISTLRLTKVTIQDSRRFQCSVNIPNDDEGTTADDTSLLVLVPPSPPICRIEGEAAYFHNITLTCKSEEGSPKPVTEWKTYSTENTPRPFPPKTTEKDGALYLFNISRETSGFFVCTSTNEIGSNHCNLTLAVMPGSMNMGSTAAIIGGVLAGVVLLGIIFFCCCRKKGKNEEYAEGNPEKVFYDKDASETGEQYYDDKPTRDQKEDKDVPLKYINEGPTGRKLEDDQHSYNSGKGRRDVQGGDTDSRRYDNDLHRGSRDRLDDRRDHNSGSRDRLDDQHDRYGGSRDRLEDQRDRYGGSRDRLEDQHDRYGGSRDRLDDRHDRYGGSRDRLDDRRDHYGGSRDRLDDQRDRYGGSRDRLDDRRDRYGSRDRLDNESDRYGGGSNHYRGSRDRLDYNDDHH